MTKRSPRRVRAGSLARREPVESRAVGNGIQAPQPRSPILDHRTGAQTDQAGGGGWLAISRGRR